MTEQSNNPIAVIRQHLAVMAPEFKAALPPHISEEKFRRVAVTAVQNTPALANADRRSLFGAFVKLAQDGLLPDGREAAIVMFGDKAQAMPMIGGILKRIRQSGEVAKVSAQVVHENDHFLVKYGFDEDVEHNPPKLNEPRGKPIGAYATAVLKDGSRLLEVMSLEDIEKVRGVSRAKNNGPWVAWWGEMARKTVMRRLSKRLPMSTDLEEQIFARDETLATDRNAMREIEVQAEPSPPVSRLDAIESQIGGETVDAETGEVTDVNADAADDQATAAPAAQDEHPAQAIADRIIAEINSPETNAVMDVAAILNRAALDLAAMPDDLAVKIEVAADKRRNAIRAEQEKAKAKAAAPAGAE